MVRMRVAKRAIKFDQRLIRDCPLRLKTGVACSRSSALLAGSKHTPHACYPAKGMTVQMLYDFPMRYKEIRLIG